MARRSFAGFIDRFTTEPPPARHHRLLIDKLENVISGDLSRLMVFMPPGSAKSYYASIMAPAYALGRNPKWNVIAASHTQELGDRWGRKVRNIVGSPSYSAVFGVGLAPDSHAVHRWETKGGAEYFAAGIGGPITGRRADLVVIDDPIKNREEAESEIYREKTWDWYRSDVRTRMKPACRIVLIQTRWHFDDLAGRILPADYDFRSGFVTARDGEQWHVLCLPALADRLDDPLGRQVGESLWPEWFSEAHFEQERISQGPRDWNALYQQRPTPDEGGYFERKWFRYYDELPKHLRLYGASDYAVTADGGDWTVHLVIGVDPNDDIYLLDLWRDRAPADVWIERLLDLVLRHRERLHVWAEEKGQIEKSVGPFIAKRQVERQVYFNRKQYASAADKPTRARAIQARMANGKVVFPRVAPWLAGLEAELLQFPAGVNDDQVDALGLIGRMLDAMGKGAAPEPAKPKPIQGMEALTYDRLWELEREHRWRDDLD